MKSKISAIVVAIGMIGSVGAQSSYPTKPIRIIVPGAAGSVSDTILRALTDKVARNLGQPIVIDNRSGAGGVVAFEACAKAPADGHTLCSIFPEPFTYTSVLEPDKYKRYATLEPVTQILTFSGVFYSNPKRKFSTFKDFIDAAKAKPEELTYSSWGPGSAPNLVYEWINKSEKVSVRHIPAKGSVEAFNDALAGTVDMGFIGLGFALTNIYGLPLNSKSLTDWGPWGKAPAVVYPASGVGSSMSRADMESASPHRHTLQAAGKLPEELSA
jgi:tripartite-type tricarboxylate transporter receptor subunit TctC